jgi:hypothetical protein
MSYLGEALIVLLALMCIALWSLWRRALQSTGARDQLWRNALTALASRDYESAGAFAAMIEDEKGAEEARGDGRDLFVTLRRIMPLNHWKLPSANSNARAAILKMCWLRCKTAF